MKLLALCDAGRTPFSSVLASERVPPAGTASPLPFRGDGLRALFLAICVHERPRASAVRPVPEGFDAWFERCTNVDPAKRCRSAAELAEGLRRVCEQPLAQPTIRDDAEASGDDAATDSLSGSVAVPRHGFEIRQRMRGSDGSKPAGADATPPRRFHLSSVTAWGGLALVLLAAAWISTREMGPIPPRISSSIAPRSSARIEQPATRSPSSNAPSVELQRAVIAPRASSTTEPARRTTNRQSHGAARKVPPPQPEVTASSTAIRQAEPAPLVPSAPSAQPEAWNFDEMLKDRK